MAMSVTLGFGIRCFREAHEGYTFRDEPFSGIQAGKNLGPASVVAPDSYRLFAISAVMGFDVDEYLSLLLAEGCYGNGQRLPFFGSAEINLAESSADNRTVAVKIEIQGDVSAGSGGVGVAADATAIQLFKVYYIRRV